MPKHLRMQHRGISLCLQAFLQKRERYLSCGSKHSVKISTMSASFRQIDVARMTIDVIPAYGRKTANRCE